MKIAVAFSGASGLQYGYRLVEVLLDNNHDVFLMSTESAAIVASKELGLSLNPSQPDKAFKEHPKSARLKGIAISDIGGTHCSGSSAMDAMVVLPCSMSALARLATGVGGRALERAAAVMLKENKPLIVVPRETPMSLIDLRNQVTLKEAGAHIVPAAPGFYTKPQSIEDIVDFMVQKVTDLLKLDITLTPRWQG